MSGSAVVEWGSTFSGVGGLDLGLERAGHRVVFQCEKDEGCRAILKQHWPEVPCYADVKEVSRKTWKGRKLGGLCGGFPCQDVSVSGRRAGLAGERSGLFFEFARIADELVRPGGWILVENVPGLLSSHGGRDFALILATLADIGFHDLAWRVLDSRYFGVPQRRRRVFILGRRATGRSACEVLLEPESGGGDFAPRSEAGARVAASATRGSSSAGVSAPGRRQEDDENIVNAVQHPGPPGTRRDDDAALVAGTLGAGRNGGGRTTDLDGHGAYVAGAVRSHMRPGSNDVGGIAVSLTTKDRGNPETEALTVAHAPQDDPLTVAGPLGGGNDGAGRRSEDDPNLVIPDGGGAPTDPDGVRAASGLPRRVDDSVANSLKQSSGRGRGWGTGPEENYVPVGGGDDPLAFQQNSRSEVRMMGANAEGDHVGALAAEAGAQQQNYIIGAGAGQIAHDPQPDGPRYAMMGNAVTVNVAEWIGHRLLTHV